MCIICLEWEKGKLTAEEALAAAGEMLNTEEDGNTKDHLFGVVNRILDAEEPFEEWDSDDRVGFLDELDDGFNFDED